MSIQNIEHLLPLFQCLFVKRKVYALNSMVLTPLYIKMKICVQIY